MARLFDRDWLVEVGSVRVGPPFHVSFKVEKSTAPEPNNLELRIWNLNPTQRKSITESPEVRVRLEAGYKDYRSQLFIGDIRKAYTERDGADLVTVLEGSEGGQAYLTARVNRAFPAGTPVSTVVKACARALGLGMGNVEELAAAAELENGGGVFPEGTVLSGSAAQELTGVLRSVGLRWSVQNGSLQVQRRGQALQGTSVLLAPRTGLVGHPQVDADGTVKLRSLLIPDVYPGRQLRVQTEDLEGTYRAEKVSYVGDTAADTWYIEAECQELLPASP